MLRVSRDRLSGSTSSRRVRDSSLWVFRKHSLGQNNPRFSNSFRLVAEVVFSPLSLPQAVSNRFNNGVAYARDSWRATTRITGNGSCYNAANAGSGNRIGARGPDDAELPGVAEHAAQRTCGRRGPRV